MPNGVISTPTDRSSYQGEICFASFAGRFLRMADAHDCLRASCTASDNLTDSGNTSAIGSPKADGWAREVCNSAKHSVHSRAFFVSDTRIGGDVRPENAQMVRDKYTFSERAAFSSSSTARVARQKEVARWRYTPLFLQNHLFY